MDFKGRERVLTIIAMLCLCALAGDKLVLSPLLHLWDKRSERIVELNELLSKGAVLLKREESMRQRWQEMRDNALLTEASGAEDGVLKSVDQWTQKSRVSITSLKPQWKQKDEEFAVLECRAAATGGIESIARFLYELEKDPLALRLEEVEISARDEKGETLTLGVCFSRLLLTEERS
ncbi:MAG: hypothetical protein ABIH23_26710 [bacterium]